MREILFRNENFRGSGVRDAVEVMAYEMFELNNVDILFTLEETIFKNYPEAKAYTNKLSSLILDEKSYDINANIRKEYVINLLNLIKVITGKDIKYALWLTDMNSAMHGMYGINQGFLRIGDCIDAYKVGDIILSNTKGDGILYGYTYSPQIYTKLYVTKADIKEENNNEN